MVTQGRLLQILISIIKLLTTNLIMLHMYSVVSSYSGNTNYSTVNKHQKWLHIRFKKQGISVMVTKILNFGKILL